MKKPIIALLSAALGVAWGPGCVAGSAQQQPAQVTQMSIHDFVQAIVVAREPERSELAGRMAQRVSVMTKAEIQSTKESEIQEVVPLLVDASPTVQHYAAITLGDLGPVASSAVPALREAAKRVEKEEQQAFIRPAASAAYTIHNAIHKITGEPIPNGVR